MTTTERLVKAESAAISVAGAAHGASGSSPVFFNRTKCPALMGSPNVTATRYLRPAASSFLFRRGHGTSDANAVDYIHARYYSPMYGRFLSLDPVLDVNVAMNHPDTWNRYSYVATIR